MASRPIPLGQLQGGGDGGGGWMMTLLVCCISSIISAIVGFFFRKQITGALGKMGGGGGGAAAAAGGGAAVGAGGGANAAAVADAMAKLKAAEAGVVRGRSAVKGRRLKIRGRRRRPRRKKRRRAMRKIGRRVGKIFGRGRKGVRKIGRRVGRGARKIGRRVGRGARKAGKLALKYHPANMARRGFNKSRLGKKFNRSKAGKKFNRGIKKLFRRRRRRCFSPETLVKLQNGNEVAMKDLKLGDVLINGSIVNGVMNILNETNPYYKIHSSELDRDIFVTGSHYIKDGNVYKAVKNFSGAEVTTKIDREVSCLITSDHKIPVGEFVFWDWEDDKIQP
jgi:hypothetical protein